MERMAKLVLGKVDYLSKITKLDGNREFSPIQVANIKSYYSDEIKKNAVEVNSILTMGRETASKIFVR